MRSSLAAAPATEPAAQPADGALIVARGVTVRHGRRTVLDAVSIAVSRGEIVSVIGPNGAGKTTLARVLLGLARTSAGTVRRAPGLGVGYVPQRLEPDAVLPIPVWRFLALARRGARTRRAARARIEAVLGDVGAARLIDQQPHSLSGGEFRRVLLARALLREPDLLILDEPVQQVDFAGQLAMYQLIGRIRDERGCGILVVSHDLHLVLGATDRVVCINGHVCCAGQPEAVSRHPEYVALFGPRAAGELAVYTHAHDHAHDISGAVVPIDDQAAGAGAGTGDGDGGAVNSR